MSTTTLAVLLPAKGAPLEITSLPLPPTPAPHQILIKTHAVAINPVDWATRDMGQDLLPYLRFPCTLGLDAAGTVVAVGSAVARRVAVGDRVLGLAGDRASKVAGAFQEYALLADNLFSRVPDGVSFEEACVLPLGLSTAASALFQKDCLALPLPALEPRPLGKTLLVWGGTSSVGCNAIQLGVAAGCEVITTCSAKNFEFVKRLGASRAFDYHGEGVVDETVAHLEGKVLAGAVSIGNVNAMKDGHDMSAGTATLEIVSRAQGTKFVAMAMMYQGPAPDGVEFKFILGDSLADTEVGHAVYADYLEKALAQGKFVAPPPPLVVGRGLESIEKALEVQKKGVSAQKVVVSM